nr:MAG TPA: hypothetical protein [Bacteriophage sp.]
MQVYGMGPSLLNLIYVLGMLLKIHIINLLINLYILF